MRIAVILSSSVHSGGGFHQELSVLELLSKQDHYTFLFFTTIKSNVSRLNKMGYSVSYLKLSFFSKALDAIKNSVFNVFPSLSFTWMLSLDKVFKAVDCQLVYFLSPTSLPLRLKTLPFIYTLWDLGHRDCLGFSEFTTKRSFEIRESRYSRILPQSFATLVSCNTFRNRVLGLYSLDPERVHVAPFFPPSFSDKPASLSLEELQQKFDISHPYILYPAQFWAHKNHRYMLDALALLKDESPLTIVFTGSDKGTLPFIKTYAQELGLDDRIIFCGFVSDDDLRSLYAYTEALVMPTLMGPTNLPPLEAFNLGVPVIYSGKEGIKEFFEKETLLCDIKNPHSLADQLRKVLSKDALVSEKITLGKAFLTQDFQAQYQDIISSILDEYHFILQRSRY